MKKTSKTQTKARPRRTRHDRAAARVSGFGGERDSGPASFFERLTPPGRRRCAKSYAQLAENFIPGFQGSESFSNRLWINSGRFKLSAFPTVIPAAG